MADFLLRIDGMHCGSCVRRVSQALEATPGLKVTEVRLGAARISADEVAAVDEAIQAVVKAGFNTQLDN